MNWVVAFLVAAMGALLVTVGAVVGRIPGSVISAVVFFLLAYYGTFTVFRKRASLVTRGLDYAYQRFIYGTDLPQSWRELAPELPWPPDVRDTFPLSAASWAVLSAKALKGNELLRVGLEFARSVYPAGSGPLEISGAD